MNDSESSFLSLKTYWLTSPLAIALTLFALVGLERVADHNMSYSELDTLMYAKQFADPEFLPGEWYLNQPGGPRRPFQVLIYPLVKSLPLVWVSIVGRALGYLFVCIPLALIARRIGLDGLAAIAVVGVYMWQGQDLFPGSDWLFKRIESLVIGYGLLFFGVHALMDRKLRLAALYAGLATTMHVLVGGWGSLALGLTVLVQRLGSWRQRWAALGIWCLAGCAGIYYALSFLWKPGPEASFNVDEIFVYFRNPHSLDPSSWHVDTRLLGTAALLLAVLASAAWRFWGRYETAVVATVALCSLVPYAVGLLISPFPVIAAEFLQLFPFRVAGTLVFVFGLMLTARLLLCRVLQPQARPWILGVAAVWLFWVNAGHFLHDVETLRRFPEGARKSSDSRTVLLYEACGWIREHTEPGALLLAPPDEDSISYLCRRPVVVRFKNDPTTRESYAEWYRRLIDFNGGKRPSKNGFPGSRQIGSNFERGLTGQQYRELARKYGAAYLLMRPRDDLGLPRLFRNRRWAVYRLDAASPG